MHAHGYCNIELIANLENASAQMATEIEMPVAVAKAEIAVINNNHKNCMFGHSRGSNKKIRSNDKVNERQKQRGALTAPAEAYQLFAVKNTRNLNSAYLIIYCDNTEINH